MNVLLPSEAACLIEYYYLPLKDIAHNHPNTLASLVKLGMIDLYGERGNGSQITDKGRAHVRHMIAVPLPEQCWRLPKSTAEQDQNSK